MKKLLMMIVFVSAVAFAETVPESEPDCSDIAIAGTLITTILAGTYLVNKRQH